MYELDPVDYKYEHPVWGPLEEGLAGPRLSMLIISWSHGQLLLDALRKLYYWVDAHVASFLDSLHGCSLSFCLSSLPFVLLVLFFFFRPHPGHIEVSRPGIQSKLQLWWLQILTHCTRQGIEPVLPQRQHQMLNLLCHSGNSLFPAIWMLSCILGIILISLLARYVTWASSLP